VTRFISQYSDARRSDIDLAARTASFR